MRILAATISGFRNLTDLDLRFSGGVNVLLGANGQGKTNLLEALNFLALANLGVELRARGADVRATGRALYDAVLAPLAPRLQGVEAVII